MRKWTFKISIIINVLFIMNYTIALYNSPTYELGRLEKDIEVGLFLTDSVILKLPKGLTVRNVSARGFNAFGQFENNRFSIVITSDDYELVNYKLPTDSLFHFGNFYSTEIHNYEDPFIDE